MKHFESSKLCSFVLFCFKTANVSLGDESKIVVLYNLTEKYENQVFIQIYVRLMLLDFLK